MKYLIPFLFFLLPTVSFASVSMSGTSSGASTDGSSGWFTDSSNATIAVWIKGTGNTGGVISNSGAFNYVIGSGCTNGQIAWLGAGSVCSTGTINDGAWHSIVSTRSGTTISHYIDGVASNTGTDSGVAFTSTVWVGSNNIGTGNYWVGNFSHLAYSNTVWTAGQISSFNTACTVTSPIAQWNFSSSGTLGTDSSGNSHTLTAQSGGFAYSTDEPTACTPIVVTPLSILGLVTAIWIL